MILGRSSVTDETEFQTPRVALGAGVVAVAVTFLFLHTFGGRVLTQLGSEIIGTDEAWRYRGLTTLVVMGGLLGALGAAMRFRLEVWQSNLGWSFRAGSMAAVFGAMVSGWSGLLGAAFAMGAAAGWILTTLATGMRSSIGTKRLGIVIGGGLALSILLGEFAFFMASLFGDPTKGAAIVVAMLLAATSVVVPFLTPLEPSMDMESGYRGRGLALNWLLMATILGAGAALHGSAPTVAGHLSIVATGVLIPLLVGRWLDADHRRYALVTGAAILAVGTLLGNSAGIGSLIPAIVTAWIVTVTFHFGARGGRVWVAAGTVGLVFFIAPFVASQIAG